MKHFFSCYFVHLGMAVMVFLYLGVVTTVGGLVAQILPVFQVQFVVLVQGLMFVPFSQYVVKMYGKGTGGVLPENGKGSYVVSFLMVHHGLILLIFLLFRGYFVFRGTGIQEGISGVVDEVVSIPESGMLQMLLEVIALIPMKYVNRLDNMILYITFYVIFVFVLMILAEYRRVQSCEVLPLR